MIAAHQIVQHLLEDDDEDGDWKDVEPRSVEVWLEQAGFRHKDSQIQWERDLTIRAIIGEAAPGAESRTYTISARSEFLDKIERLLAWMNMTAGGHSGTASISIDGDGAARIRVEKKGGDLPKHKDEDNNAWSGKSEFHVGLD